MKKSLKLVGIFIGVLIVVIVGGLSIYFLVQNNKTYYIYDLRIVEPVGDVNFYVYTDKDYNYTSIKNKSVYLHSKEENMFGIAIYVNNSIDSTNVSLTSSNNDVAKILYLNNKCYVNYIRAGEATISVSMGTVTDSFVLKVYDEVADNFTVLDSKYYGDYQNDHPNQIMAYADNAVHKYNYKVNVQNLNLDASQINNDMLRVTCVDDNLFESVVIDAENQTLNVKCKAGLTSDVDTILMVQSFTQAEGGAVKVLSSQVVDVHIVAHTPKFLQIELSTTPDFADGAVFVDTDIVTMEQVNTNPDLLENYLNYVQVEGNLSARNENAIYNTYFTPKVSRIYLKLRKVYANGDVVYLNPLDESNPYSVTTDSHLKLSANKKYYILELDSTYFASNSNFTLNLKLLGENYLEKSFVFEYADFTEANKTKFYKEEGGIYKYIYWDPRTHFAGEIYNPQGDIINIVF